MLEVSMNLIVDRGFGLSIAKRRAPWALVFSCVAGCSAINFTTIYIISGQIDDCMEP